MASEARRRRNPSAPRRDPERFDDAGTRIVLTGSGGGADLRLPQRRGVPDEIDRIAFLDANYAYEMDRHRNKLWPG